MKAITLHQPWATLVALGVKTVETRSWATKYRGPLAIHAGARQVHTGNFFLLARLALKAGLIDTATERQFRVKDVPFGKVVATCTLVEVVPMITVAEAALHPGPWLTVSDQGLGLWRGGVQVAERVSDQRPYGDYRPGRFAWVLDDIKPVDPPAPARGYQGAWEWTP